jgi:hypothetical protein
MPTNVFECMEQSESKQADVLDMFSEGRVVVKVEWFQVHLSLSLSLSLLYGNHDCEWMDLYMSK